MVIEMNKVKDWIKNHKFIIFIFLFSLILRIGVILVIDTPVISDFKTMLDASLEIVNKTDHYKTMPYFLLWGYQMGHVLYQAILLSIINSITFLKVVNAIVTSLTVVMIYVIGKKLANEKAVIIKYSINKSITTNVTHINCYLLMDNQEKRKENNGNPNRTFIRIQ